LEKERTMEANKITRTVQPYRVLPDDCHPLLMDAPHFCPKCMTGYGCEDEPCTAAYESTCKSCIADPVGHVANIRNLSNTRSALGLPESGIRFRL
jgi:hypothetical protein